MGHALFDLTGLRALITGSSQGIGLALAKGLAEAGAEIVLNGRDIGKLEAAAQDIGGDTRILAFDVTDHAVARAAIDRFEADIGAIDILVNNAGMQHRAPLEDFPAEAFEKLLATNISSVFNVGQAVGRHMIARKRGKIINIASVQTRAARPTIAPYTATKGAVGNLTMGMATDWARHGLQCNAIAPGYFETPLNAALVADPAFTGNPPMSRISSSRFCTLPRWLGQAVFSPARPAFCRTGFPARSARIGQCGRASP